MFIQTEHTPNPATLKFLPGCPVMETGTANFPSSGEAQNSPVARGLFGVDGVSGIFLGSDFITVTKTDDKDWEILKPQILGSIMDHFQSGKAVMTESAEQGEAEESKTENDLDKKIKELIDTRVRPAVAQDGGDIIYKGFEDGIVYLHMQGACAGCPSSTATLKHGIENMLKHYLPEVTEVRAID